MTNFKKLMYLCLISPTLFINTSCSNIDDINNYVGKEYLPYNLSINSLVTITSEEFLEKINLLKTNPNVSNNFLILIYSLDCKTCLKVDSYINNLTTKEHFVIYGIEYTNYKNIYDTYKDDSNYTSIFYNITSYPTFLYYKSENQQVKCTLQPLGTSFYKDDQSFLICLHKFFSSSKIYFLNDVNQIETTSFHFNRINLSSYSYLEYKIQNSSKISVFYTWNKCPDCSSLFDDFLYEYSKNNDVDIYCFEVSYFRENKELYSSFVEKFQYKNQEGYIPSLVYYENSISIDSCKFDTTSTSTIQSSIDKIKSIYSKLD